MKPSVKVVEFSPQAPTCARLGRMIACGFIAILWISIIKGVTLMKQKHITKINNVYGLAWILMQ